MPLPKTIKRLIGLCLLLGSLGLIYRPSLTAHVRRSSNPLCFNNDVRQWIWPLYRYRDSSLFKDDYIGDYYLSALVPNGYRAFFAMGASWWDPASLSKALPYVLLILLLAAVGATAGKFGGLPAAWAALAFTLSSGHYLFFMGGGLPRAFAMPLLAWAAFAATYGRVDLLAVLVVLAAAFYPTMALSLGITLALILVVLPEDDRSWAGRWSLPRRVATLGLVGLLSALVVLPTLWSSRRYGPFLKPGEAASYPEAGLGQRFIPENLPTQYSFTEGLTTYASKALVGAGRPWHSGLRGWVNEGKPSGQPSKRRRLILLAIGGTTAVGFTWLGLRDAAARRLLALAAAVVVSYGLSYAFAPYLFLPSRHLRYSVPLLVTIMFPSALSALAGWAARLARRPGLRHVGVLSVAVLVLALLGGRGSDAAGLDVCLGGDQKVYEAVRALPAESLVAGWPEGPMDNVPYLCRRRAFVTYETHIPFHKGYLDEMRRRMRALIEAYFASSPEPLVRLRDEFGVTHLLVDTRHYSSNRPSYFKPFDEWVDTAYTNGQRAGFEAPRRFAEAGVFSDGPYVLLDLSRLSNDR